MREIGRVIRFLLDVTSKKNSLGAERQPVPWSPGKVVSYMFFDDRASRDPASVFSNMLKKGRYDDAFSLFLGGSTPPELDVFTRSYGMLPVEVVARLIQVFDALDTRHGKKTSEWKTHSSELSALMQKLVNQMQKSAPFEYQLHPMLSGKLIRILMDDVKSDGFPMAQKPSSLPAAILRAHPAYDGCSSAEAAAAASSAATLSSAFGQQTMQEQMEQLGMFEELLSLYRCCPELLCTYTTGGYLPLHRAIGLGKRDFALGIVMTMGQVGYSVDALDRHGKTALQFLANMGDPSSEFAEILMAAGADPTKRYYSRRQRDMLMRGIPPTCIRPDGGTIREQLMTQIARRPATAGSPSAHESIMATIDGWASGVCAAPKNPAELDSALGSGNLVLLREVLRSSTLKRGVPASWLPISADGRVEYEKLFSPFIASIDTAPPDKQLPMLVQLLATLSVRPEVQLYSGLAGLLQEIITTEESVDGWLAEALFGWGVTLQLDMRRGNSKQVEWLLEELGNDEGLVNEPGLPVLAQAVKSGAVLYMPAQGANESVLSAAIKKQADEVVRCILFLGFDLTSQIVKVPQADGSIVGLDAVGYVLHELEKKKDTPLPLLFIMEMILAKYKQARAMYRPFGVFACEFLRIMGQYPDDVWFEHEHRVLNLVMELLADVYYMDPQAQVAIDSPQPSGQLPLEAVCMTGNLQGCRILLALGATPNPSITRDGATYTLLEQLMSLGAELNLGIVESLATSKKGLGINQAMVEKLSALYKDKRVPEAAASAESAASDSSEACIKRLVEALEYSLRDSDEHVGKRSRPADETAAAAASAAGEPEAETVDGCSASLQEAIDWAQYMLEQQSKRPKLLPRRKATTSRALPATMFAATAATAAPATSAMPPPPRKRLR